MEWKWVTYICESCGQKLQYIEEIGKESIFHNTPCDSCGIHDKGIFCKRFFREDYKRKDMGA